MFRYLLLALIFFISMTANATQIFIMNSTIDENMALRFRAVAEKDESIILIIDSGGGLISAAETIAGIMRSNGDVHCFIREAYSAAFEIIMPACNTRYMSLNSVLGFHTAHLNLNGYFGAADLMGIVKELNIENQKMFRHLIKSFPKEVNAGTVFKSLIMEINFQIKDIDKVDPALRGWLTEIYEKDCYPISLFSSQACPAFTELTK